MGADCPVEAPDDASASDAAIRCGREVEVLSERTEWQTVHALPDGQLRLDTSVSAQRTRVSGEWTAIDTSLVATAEGIGPVAPAVGMVFSDGTPGQPLVRMERDGHELTFDAPFPVGVPVVFGSTLEYRGVLDGVDLILTVDADGTGFSEVLRVQSPEAAADPRIGELTFPVAVSDGLALVGQDGGFVARDASGAQVFRSPPAVMWDSGADLAAPGLTPRVSGLQMMTASDGSVLDEGVLANRAARQDGPLEGDHAAVMDVEVRSAAGAVVVTPDGGILSDPATVWPVYIDPSVTASLADWTTISSAGWIHYRYTGDDGLGYCNSTAMGCSTPLFRSRMAWEFGGLTAIAPLDRPDIVSATFSAYGTHSYSCTPYAVSAWRVGGFTSHTGWPWVEMYGYSLHTQSVTHRAGCGSASQQPRWIEFDVTQALMQIAEEDRSAVAIGLRDPYETSMAGWKRYRSDARLSVTFNRAPSAPTDPAVSNTATGAQLACGTAAAPTWVRTRQPFMSATASDPDGGNVMARFDVYAGGALEWDGGQTAAQASGQRHVQQVGVPLDEGTAYSWTVFAYDGSRASASGRTCYFRVDATSPAAAVVDALPPAGAGQATYPPDVAAGGVGLAGRFRFSSPSSDVVSFAYGFDTTSMSGTVPVSDPVVVFPATSSGWHTLRVQAVDAAGRTSPVTLYEFGVANPQQSVWLLEEGPGATTSVDSGDFGNQLPLTLSGSPTWVDGPLTEDGSGTDWALAFDDPADVASTLRPAVLAGQSFSVSAIVRSDAQPVTATAVSQDGATGPAFELGQLAGPACSDGVGPCWAFQMPSPTGAGTVAAVFDDPVLVDEWVQVTGTFDASSGVAALHVCRPLWGVPELGGQVTASGAGLGVGSLRLGRSEAGGAASPWLGEVAEVRIYDAVIDHEVMRATCWPVAS